MQLSVPRYKAIDVGRGANLDTIDQVLNDRLWLLRQFESIKKLDSEPARPRADRWDRELVESRAGRFLRGPGRSGAPAAPGHGLGL